MSPKNWFRLILTLVLLGVFIAIWPFAQVPAGYRGVVTTFGNPSENVRTEGLHLILPIAQKMNLVYVGVMKSDDTGQAASRDMQNVNTTITLNYHIKPQAVVSVFVNLGNDPEVRIVQPSVQEAVKAVTAKFTAEELISKRELVRNEIISDLTERMERHGLGIDEFSITNFNFSPSFNEAIEAKTTAEQLKLKAMRDLERIKVEAEQKVVRAQAEADALAVQRQQITPELLSLRRIENEKAAIDKWSGNLPTYITSGAPVPFLNLQPTGGQ